MFTRLLLFLCAVSAWATTTVYLRDNTSGQFQVTGTATVSSSIQIATAAAHGLSTNDNISINNVCGTFAANGLFKVKAVQDSTHFTIKTPAGADVALDSAWCSGSAGSFAGGPQWGGKVASYTLPDGPKGGPFDGWGGKMTRAFTIRPANGLVSLTVASNVVTMTTSFTPDLIVGEKVAIWGTTSANLTDSGRPWTVATITPGSPNSTTTLTSGTAGSITNGTYTNNGACGTSGTAECVSISERVWNGANWYNGNAGFDAVTSCNAAIGNHDFQHLKSCALISLANPSSTLGLSESQMMLRAVDEWMADAAGSIWANETQTHGGNTYFADFGSYSIYDAALLYAVYAADWLTPTERQHFADVMLNDIHDPGSCTKNAPVLGNGTVTISGSNITGSGTNFTTYSVGDVLIEKSLIDTNANEPHIYVYKITAITDNTHIAVLNFGSGTFSGSPSQFYRIPKWTTGMCGAIWMKRHWGGGSLGHPSLYPLNGNEGYYPGNPYGGGGSNNEGTELMGLGAMAAALADQDARAVRLFEQQEAWWWDKFLPFSMGYHTGFTQSGSGYQYARTAVEGLRFAFHLSEMVPAFPDLHLSGPWAGGILTQMQYVMLPDNFDGDGKYYVMSFGAVGGDGLMDTNTATTPILNSSPFMTFFPTDPKSKYYFDWLSSTGRQNAWMSTVYADRGLTWMNNQRQTRVDYTTQPTQYWFHDSNATECTALTGDSHCSTMRADAFLSRTGWSQPSNDTLMMYLGITFFGDHNTPAQGSIRVYKRGYLLGQGAGGAAPERSTWIYDTLLGLTVGTDYLSNGTSQQPVMSTPMTKWAGAGNSDINYGDASSRYAYARVDNAQMFTVPPTFAIRDAIHFKKTGTEELVFQVDRVDNTNLGGQATFPMHWAQSATTCPGAGGCGSLDTNGRHVETAESGVGALLYGLGTTFMSPGTITVAWDGAGYATDSLTYRARVCGGASCGGTANTLEAVTVHKIGTIAGGLGITTSAPLTDSTHYVVRADDKIVGMARGTSLVTSYPSHTIPSGITQALYTDMAPGTYSATIGGSCTVVANDNTCYLEPNGTGGTMTITAGAGTAPTITTSSLPNGTNGVAYSQTLTFTGDTPTWSVTVGSLPAWASLNTITGAITGTPNAVATTSFTVTATNGTGSDSKALSITIVAASTAGSVVRATGVRGTIIK